MATSSAATASPPEPARAPSAPKPAADNRLKILEGTMRKHQHASDALLEVLHKAQELFGYLSPELLTHVAKSLRVPPSRVYGVATFYHFFSLAAPGEHSCSVCMGTACYVKGAAEILSAVERETGVKAGQTTPDGQVTVSIARCVGTCGIAPAVVFDGAVVGQQTAQAVLTKVKGWRKDGAR